MFCSQNLPGRPAAVTRQVAESYRTFDSPSRHINMHHMRPSIRLHDGNGHAYKLPLVAKLCNIVPCACGGWANAT